MVLNRRLGEASGALSHAVGNHEAGDDGDWQLRRPPPSQ
jgi:hypothetical protein